MIPGPSRILTCPFCGGEKKVMTLASGNTFGAEVWSDNKRIAPMLPEISYIQKCPHCGKYFITSRQEIVYDRDGRTSFEQGILSYDEMKEAFAQICSEGFDDQDEEASVRMMMFHAFNDHYHRRACDVLPSEEDVTLFREQGLWLLDNIITDNVLKAEFYREISEMQKAQEIIDNTSPDEDFLRNIMQQIKERVQANDSRVFKLKL